MASLLLWTLVLAASCSEVRGKLKLYGEGVSNINQQEFLKQICPKDDTKERKYVRIKTYNNKYVYANAQHKTDLAYLRTRCCGGKDAVGRKDVKVPSRRSTFLIHCKRVNGQTTVRFEILNREDNRPSGYYFYAYKHGEVYGLYANKPEWYKSNEYDFKLQRWRGPVVAMQTVGKWASWLTFKDGSDTDGRIYARKRVQSSNGKAIFPGLIDSFTLEAVSSGCVDAAEHRDRVWAAEKKTSHEECERKPDRCFWTDGWDFYHQNRMLPGTCYYSKDSMCYWDRQSKDLPTSRLCKVAGKTISGPAADCESAYCCYDYKRNQCYKASS